MPRSPFRIGLISDTHGLLRPEALAALRGVAAIIHAGDIGDRCILDQLARLAPVTAVRGNNDRDAAFASLPERARLSVRGLDIDVVHDLAELLPGPRDVVVSGHSHRPRIVTEEGVLLVNPGSAGPRRFRLPVSLGFLFVERGRARAELATLDCR